MSTPKPNVAELRRVLAHVEANQKLWHQHDYRIDLDTILDDAEEERCGTAYCFAGWKAQLDGVKWKNPANAWHADVIVLPDGSETTADKYAAEALGIEGTREPLYDEIPLFAGDNTLDDLRRIVDELCGGAE